MLLTCFNCATCKKPFDCKEDMPNTPVLGDPAKVTNCAGCEDKGPEQVPYRGLLQFLDQPGLEKTDTGYEYTGQIVYPSCKECGVKLNISKLAYKLGCGHWTCCHNKGPVKCLECETMDEGGLLWHDSRIRKFLEEDDNHLREEGLQQCGDCGLVHQFSHLFRCMDCTITACGVCAFKIHRQHEVSELLELELDVINKVAKDRFDEAVTGLAGNLRYLHQEVDKAVEALKAMGIQRLEKTKKLDSFPKAKKALAPIKEAAKEFEEYCEEYFPMMRIFTVKIRRLNEQLDTKEIQEIKDTN
ncbi:unnamed protein product, partial [Mesorhabditis spiculigera]